MSAMTMRTRRRTARRGRILLRKVVSAQYAIGSRVQIARSGTIIREGRSEEFAPAYDDDGNQTLVQTSPVNKSPSKMNIQ